MPVKGWVCGALSFVAIAVTTSAQAENATFRLSVYEDGDVSDAKVTINCKIEKEIEYGATVEASYDFSAFGEYDFEAISIGCTVENDSNDTSIIANLENLLWDNGNVALTSCSSSAGGNADGGLFCATTITPGETATLTSVQAPAVEEF